jgi:acetate CoA/acetoacetate CoA-transferase beta subunit
MGVMEITDKGILLTEIHPEFSIADVQAATEAELIISKNLKSMNV